MLPSFAKQPEVETGEEQQQSRIPRYPKLKTGVGSVRYFISTHHCAWITVTIFLQLVTTSFLLNRTSYSTLSSAESLRAFAPRQDEDVCKIGRIYVYDLPPLLNQDLLDNCHELAQWGSLCTALSNDGFGPPAVDLSGVIPYNLTPAWHWTDLYAGEPIFHHRMMNYKCRTMYEDDATVFYIPFYVGLDVGKY